MRRQPGEEKGKVCRGKGRETLSPEQLKQSPDRIGLRNRMRIIIFIFVFFYYRPFYRLLSPRSVLKHRGKKNSTVGYQQFIRTL